MESSQLSEQDGLPLKHVDEEEDLESCEHLADLLDRCTLLRKSPLDHRHWYSNQQIAQQRTQ